MQSLAARALLLPAVRAARRPALGRQLASSSLINRVFGGPPPLLYDTPFSMLPRLIAEDFTRSLDMLNRAVGGLVHVEQDDETKVRGRRAAAHRGMCASPHRFRGCAERARAGAATARATPARRRSS